MQFQECLSETCGECRSRLCNSTLSTCKFCCKSGKEVVLCLLWCQDRYRRKYAECVSRKEDYILCCRCGRNRTYNIFNMINRIRYTCILCYTLICKINFSVCIYCYVLKKGISADCIVDIRLRLGIQVDNFCITSTFKVEDAVVIPAVLVITNQETFRVCRQCCFTSTGKTKEDCCVLSIHICVCGAVHGSNSVQWKVVVHHGEHTFLHLTAVPCINDNLLTACNVECYTSLGIQSKFFVVFYFCFRSVVYNKGRLKSFKFCLSRLDEHVLNEMCLPCYFNDETNSHTGICICSTESIYNKKSFVRKFFLCNIFYGSPCFFCHRMVIVCIFIRCPPYCVFGILIHNNVLVFRRTSGINTCHNVYCTKLCFLSYFISLKPSFCLFLE